jgi:hypothetical protein
MWWGVEAVVDKFVVSVVGFEFLHLVVVVVLEATTGTFVVIVVVKTLLELGDEIVTVDGDQGCSYCMKGVGFIFCSGLINCLGGRVHYSW